MVKNPVTKYLPHNAPRVGMSFSAPDVKKMPDFVGGLDRGIPAVITVRKRGKNVLVSLPGRRAHFGARRAHYSKPADCLKTPEQWCSVDVIPCLRLHLFHVQSNGGSYVALQ